MASSFPQFYSELLYPNNFSDGMLGIRSNNMELAGGEEGLIPSFDQTTVSPVPDHPDALLAMPYPDPYGSVSDMTVPTLPDQFNMGLCSIHSLVGGRHHPPAMAATTACDFGDELFSFVPDFKPLYHDSWVTQSNEMHGVEETNIKVASRYSEEERKERILRYLKKRNQRNFNKTIKYACRKTLADRRTRVRGRFARNNELCDPELMALKTNQISSPSHNLKQQRETNKEEEESWLQELAASLMYLPYVTNYSGLGV